MKIVVFAGDIFNYNFMNENCWVSIKISLKFVAEGSIDNKPAIGSDNGSVPSRQQPIT